MILLGISEYSGNWHEFEVNDDFDCPVKLCEGDLRPFLKGYQCDKCENYFKEKEG